MQVTCTTHIGTSVAARRYQIQGHDDETMLFPSHKTVLGRRLVRFSLILLTLVVLSSPGVRAQTLPQGVEQGPTIAGITEYTFANGLRALLLPDPGSSTITVNVTYLVGSRHEGYGETGMAHLLEHLNFIESTNGVNIKQQLEDHGARWNGTTWYDRTNYFETVNASAENLRWALDLEAERMVNMRIDQAILDTEMTVVRNEFERGENNPTSVLDDRLFSTAYLWHNYGKPTIGSRSDIENVTIDRLQAFYRKYYRPDNAIVIVAGQVNAADTLAMLKDTLGAIPRPDQPLAPTYTAEPPQDGERRVELRRVGSGQHLMVGYHAPGMAHPDSASLEVLAGVLTGGGTGRLDQAIEDTQVALSIGTSVYQLHDPGLVVFSASLNDDQSLIEVQTILFDTLADLADQGPTPEEVDRARTRLIQGMDRLFANSQRLAMELSETVASGDWRLLFANYEEVQRVTPEDVQSVAARYFKESNRTIATFISGPAGERVIVPDAPGIDTLLAAYPPEIDIETGEALDPSPASIEARVERSTLEGGLRLALLPKDTRGRRVQASLTLRFGEPSTLGGRQTAAEITSALLLRGTRSRTRQQLQDEMQELNTTINISGQLASVTASISTTAENLIPALRLAAEILREPGFPETDFGQIRDQRIAALERNRTEPGALAFEMLQRNLSPYARDDVRYVRTMDEEIEDLRAVTLAEVRQFHEEFFGASEGELVAVGRFDAAEVRTWAVEILGPWQSANSYSPIVSEYLDVEPINSEIDTPDKENAQFSAGLRLRMTDADSDYPAMVMANYMLGGGITARLPDRIRNREGLSYSVGSSFSAPAMGDAAIFSASAIANPQNIASVEASFFDELARTLDSGFTEEELATARAALLDERTGGRSSDRGVLNLIGSRERWQRTLEWDAELETRLTALTLAEVNAAFRRHIDPEAISVVKGGDFGRDSQ